ncbi:MAG: alpha/beta hydrolase [Clostridia bacterium]|nr:alpha/beta hydrolase [Clostridia bacterium]
MQPWMIALIIFFVIAVLVLGTALVCFLIVFYSPKRKQPREDEYPTPEGAVYDEYREQMEEWIKAIRTMEHTEVSVTSYDGLRLCGAYYEHKKGAPIEILFHGYRGTGERDLNGGVFRCFALGRNALIVDHRAAGKSAGHVITFGIKESRDALTWVDFVLKYIDKDAKIILTGISMGASTVMMAASMPLPHNVVGILADCGYTSTKAIIQKVSADMKLPAKLVYPFIKLGARLFGGFDSDAASPIESMKHCHLPVIFFHGDADDFVPASMSEENFAVCTAEHKRLVLIRGAGHGLAFPVDQDVYLNELRSFFEPILQTEVKQSATEGTRIP